MHKSLARQYKNHYGVRWSSFKHNRKNKEKILLLEDKFIIGHSKGSVLSLDSLGEQYYGVLDIDITPNKSVYNTLLLLNCISFKYKTVKEILDDIVVHSIYIESGGHLILNLNFRYLKYDRLNISTHSLINSIINLIIDKGFSFVRHLHIPKIVNFGYGELFLAFKKL
jgi:hypothetical protein